MAFDSNAFVADILNGVQVDEHEKAALTKIVANPIVAKRFEENGLRQSEFSKKMEELNQKVKAAQDYHQGLVKWKNDESAAIEKEKALLRGKLADEGIGLTDGEPTVTQGVTKEEFLKLQQDFLAYNSAVNAITLKHFKEFGEVLDINDVLKVSADNGGINVNLAYEKLIQPKRDELQKADIEKQLAAAREEGRLEAVKNFNMPSSDIATFSTGTHPLDGLKKTEGGPEYGAMSATKAWSEAKRSGKLAEIPF